MKFVPLNFLSTTSNFKLLLSSCSKSSGWIKSLTDDPRFCFLIKLPLIVPNSVFSKLSTPVTFASIKIPLFKNLLLLPSSDSDKCYKEYQTVSKTGSV